MCLQRISQKGTTKKKKRGHPVLLQHGLFQSAGIFVVSNKKKSLAYYLCDLGYDVWLGNNRGVYEDHSHLTSKDPRYWDWNIHDLGRFDFPTMVQYVHTQTEQRVTFIGHSQGNAQAFAGLCHDPDIAQYLDLFVALAPAYYVNDFKHWSLKLLQKLPDSVFELIFGSTSFIPIMHKCQLFFHKRIFSSFAYIMFAYLFGWTSDRWKKGRKPAIFQTTPRPISTKLIRNWLDISRSGRLKSQEYSDIAQARVAEERHYELGNVKCPVAVFWGKGDSLVDGERLVVEMRKIGVNLVFELGIEGYEHMDLLWAGDVVEKVFKHLERLLEERRSGREEKESSKRKGKESQRNNNKR
uniref:Partial AB-hydrolase lipase domain-containing protein n=1 Tax=Arcella intermedia TaxID=1963864 RepID=A0A6B2L7M9_9EUKA